MKYLIYALIRCYQWVVSPVIHTICGPGCGCRFTPSCSQYFFDAVRLHGALRGSVLGVKRICRCHPRGGFGHDPVPDPLGKGVNSSPVEPSPSDGKNSSGQCERSALYDSPPNRKNFSPGNHPFLNHRHHG
jgi:putative membrane protein insertion efficiency factor